jgi:hypothetical protein
MTRIIQNLRIGTKLAKGHHRYIDPATPSIGALPDQLARAPPHKMR